MVRDDLESCLQAYQFAQLCLSGFAEKSERERSEALRMARVLRDEVESKYARLQAEPASHRPSRLSTLRQARERLEEHLAAAARRLDAGEVV